MNVLFWGSTRITALLYEHRRILEQFFEIPYADEFERIRDSLTNIEASLANLNSLLRVTQLALGEAMRRLDKPPSRVKTSVDYPSGLATAN